ncbi:MAG: hypothetical protein M0P57_00825 [Syntrophales bacterium]|jgi:8-oxo-dGTP pyrophosphatase MutT (NUDIX family)|nr:hypothetical protein [Syntrophales bacterium]MDY0044210.1 hypothetical protein [Syntrophales bacterium]
MAVTPRDAATVILLRKARSGKDEDFEVLMALRNRKSSFVPSSYVFPGGRVDDEDCLTKLEKFCRRSDLEKAKASIEKPSFPEIDLGLWIAAIRETFEEMGLLYAYRKDGSFMRFDGSNDEIEKYKAYRKSLADRSVSFAEILSEERLTLALDQLYYFSHWITPELSPKRFDTRFFVAEAPRFQTALHDGQELTTHLWIRPRKALEQYWRHQFHMVVPTIVTLEELSRFKRIADVIESTRGKEVQSVMTRIVVTNGEVQEHAPDGRIFRNLVASE